MKGRTRPEGVVKSNHALGHSLSGSHEAPEGLGLFEQWGEEARSEGIQRKTGNEDRLIPDGTVLDIYDALQREETSQRGVAESFGVSKYTVHRIATGKGRFGEIVDGNSYAKSDRHRHRISESAAKHSPSEIRRAYRLAHGENGLTQEEIGEMCGGMHAKTVSGIKRGVRHAHLTRDIEEESDQ